MAALPRHQNELRTDCDWSPVAPNDGTYSVDSRSRLARTVIGDPGHHFRCHETNPYHDDRGSRARESRAIDAFEGFRMPIVVIESGKVVSALPRFPMTPLSTQEVGRVSELAEWVHRRCRRT